MSEKHVSGQFRESFKGYNKDDVNLYIQQMFHQFEERERNLIRQRSQMPQNPQGYGTNEQAEQLKALLNEKESELAALKERMSELEERAVRYERMSAQVGDILLRAQSDADRITEAASASAQARLSGLESEAKAIRDGAEAYAATVRSEALKQADTIITYAADRMKHLYNEETEGYAKVLETLKHQTEHFAEKLNQYRASFPQEVQDAQDIAKEAVRQIAIDLPNLS